MRTTFDGIRVHREYRVSQTHRTIRQILIAIVVSGIMCGYMAWLDSGCRLNGVMTWHGKVCVFGHGK